MYVGVSGAPPLNPLTTSTPPVYLGTFESAPQIQWNAQFEPVMNDIAGSRLPYDMMYQGTDATIFGDLTIWNWVIWDRIRSRPIFSNTPDVNSFLDVGSLMLTEGMTYPLWVVYPFGSKAVYAAAGMPGGHHFLAAYLMGPDTESMGTKANKIHVQFHALRAFDPTTGGHKLADTNMTGIPAFPPTSPLGV